MNLFKNKQQKATAETANERLAAMIAGKVITLQYNAANAMNKWFNAYSANHKKWIMFFVGLLVSAILVSGVSSSFYRIPLEPAHHCSSAHIGMPSETPHREINNNQLTDSLTIKK